MTKLPGCRPVFEPDDFQPIREIISGKFSFHNFVGNYFTERIVLKYEK